MADRKPSYWAVIPADVRYDAELPASAKLLYGEISAMTTSTGFCWASNEYLGELLGLSKPSVQRLIRTLADRGYVSVAVIRDPKTKEVKERQIYSGMPFAAGNPPPSPHFQHEGSCQKQTDPSPQKCDLYNDNSFKNLSNINPPISPNDKKKQKKTGLTTAMVTRITEYAGADEALLRSLLAFAEKRKALRKPIDTDRTLTLLLKTLDRNSGGDREAKLLLIDKAIEHSWLTFYPLRDDDRTTPTPARTVEEPEEVERW